jgi:hypothetical protein
MQVIERRRTPGSDQPRERVNVDGYDFNTLRTLAHQHQDTRLREAAMERLAHESRDRSKRHVRVRLTVGSLLKPRRQPQQPRFEG